MYRPYPIQKYEAELLDVIDLTPTDKEFVFKAPEMPTDAEGKVGNFGFHPGQFITFLFDHEGKPLRRPYSISSAPCEKHIATCVKKVEGGPGTTMLWNLKIGDKVRAMVPLGVFTLREEHMQHNLVFIATGTGIGPFRSMIVQLLHDGFEKHVTLVAGVRHEDSILYADLFTDLADKHDNFTYISTVSQPTSESYTGNVGRVGAMIEKHITQSDAGSHFFLCGLYDMIKTVGHQLTEDKQIPRTQIHFERYD